MGSEWAANALGTLPGWRAFSEQSLLYGSRPLPLPFFFLRRSHQPSADLGAARDAAIARSTYSTPLRRPRATSWRS